MMVKLLKNHNMIMISFEILDKTGYDYFQILKLLCSDFSKIMIKQTGNFNTVYALEKGYDGQKIILFNNSETKPFFIDKLALSITSGFAGISGPNNISLKVDVNAGIELYYDACFEKWNILENKTVA